MASLLSNFYNSRITKLRNLKLKNVLVKNPYLFRACGVRKASEIIEGILSAFLSSSEETIFGNCFFEPLAQLSASKTKNARFSEATGIDISYEDSTTYTAIAIKSSVNAQNASAQTKQNDEFVSLMHRLSKNKKKFDAIIGHCYGRATGSTPKGKIFRRLAGQAFWAEITGDPDFYLRIIKAMGSLPEQHRLQYDEERAALSNRLDKQFVLNFVDRGGRIQWDKLVRYNSGRARPEALTAVAPEDSLPEVIE